MSDATTLAATPAQPAAEGATPGPARLAVVSEPVEAAAGGGPIGDASVGAGGAVRHLSPSSASTFRQCARRWEYRYLRHLPDPKGIPALVGTFVHRILEDLLHFPTADRSLDLARKLARSIWPELATDADFVALGLDERNERGVRWQSWRLVEGYFEMEDPATVDVAAREQRLEVDLSGVPFVGVVDRTERTAQGMLVTDYKTGRPPAARYEDDRLDQVWLYAAALDVAGQPVDRVRLMYLGSRSIERRLERGSLDNAVSRHADTWERIGAAVAAGDFQATTGPLCAWCPYQARCPEGQREVERRYGPAA